VRTYCFVQFRNLLAVSLLSAATVPAAGQEIHWCRDYRTAWEESHATGRPLLLDFGTQSCFWCKKLDATTFRDPGVVEMVNGGFVALHVDANREPALLVPFRSKVTRRSCWPGQNGTVLGRVIGYTDAARFKQRLQEVLARIPAPDQPRKDYQEAAAAIAQPDYPRAIALLQKVLADGSSQPVQHEARALLQEFGATGRQPAALGTGPATEGAARRVERRAGRRGANLCWTAAAREAGQMLLSARAR